MSEFSDVWLFLFRIIKNNLFLALKGAKVTIY